MNLRFHNPLLHSSSCRPRPKKASPCHGGHLFELPTLDNASSHLALREQSSSRAACGSGAAEGQVRRRGFGGVLTVTYRWPPPATSVTPLPLTPSNPVAACWKQPILYTKCTKGIVLENGRISGMKIDTMGDQKAWNSLGKVGALAAHWRPLCAINFCPPTKPEWPFFCCLLDLLPGQIQDQCWCY